MFQWFPVHCSLIIINTSVTCSYLSGSLERVDLLHHPLQYTGILHHEHNNSLLHLRMLIPKWVTLVGFIRVDGEWLGSSYVVGIAWQIGRQEVEMKWYNRTDVLYWCKSGKVPKFNQWWCLQKVLSPRFINPYSMCSRITTPHASVTHMIYLADQNDFGEHHWLNTLGRSQSDVVRCISMFDIVMSR